MNDALHSQNRRYWLAIDITGTEVTKQSENDYRRRQLAPSSQPCVKDAAFSTTSSSCAPLRRRLSVGEVFTVFGGSDARRITRHPPNPAAKGVTVPLLATQLLWINLLTDAAPRSPWASASTADVMARKPHKLTDRVIDAEMWGDIIFIGVIMAAYTPDRHGHALGRRSVHRRPFRRSRSVDAQMTETHAPWASRFSSFAQMLNALASRSLAVSVRRTVLQQVAMGRDRALAHGIAWR